jgi:hypothetical protein
MKVGGHPQLRTLQFPTDNNNNMEDALSFEVEAILAQRILDREIMHAFGNVCNCY